MKRGCLFIIIIIIIIIFFNACSVFDWYLLFDSAEGRETSHARVGSITATHTHSHAKANTDICTALNSKTSLVCYRIVLNTRSLPARIISVETVGVDREKGNMKETPGLTDTRVMIHDVEDTITPFLHIVIRTDAAEHRWPPQVTPGLVTEVPANMMWSRAGLDSFTSDTHLSSMRHLLSRTLQFSLKSS